MAEQPAVYQATTEANTSKGGACCLWRRHLDPPRIASKLLEMVLSFIAFVCEEFVEHCHQCSGLYFFEFVSCTAFLLCLVVLVVYCTKLADKFSLKWVKRMDFWYTVIVGIFFFVASIIFATTNSGSTVEMFSVAFGFLASFIFLVDFGLLWRKEGAQLSKCCQREGTAQNQSRPGENVALHHEGAEA